MSGKTINSKLAAILYADIAGYSRHTGRDEVGTHRRAMEALDFTSESIGKRGGTVLRYAGDALLAEFPSLVAAVGTATEIQNELARRNADLPEDERIQLRVGINLGEVLQDRGEIYGDGVNLAARLEAAARPGGVCISAAVWEQVAGKLAAGFTDGGEQEFKNIARPVRVYHWHPGMAEADRPEAPRRTGKPSIAVLPFTNMSGDPEQEYFADGMADDIITELSRMPWFSVIARNSSFVYKGRAIDVRQVGREFGVAYVLEGSVRRARHRLRINAQLVDTSTGDHVWADRFDREITDIFDIQDEITAAVIAAVGPELVSAELRKSRQKDPADLNAWECLMRGRAHVWKLSREDSAQARELFEKALELSPERGLGASDLALVHFLDAFYAWGDSPAESWKLMVETAEKAAALDENDPLALSILAWAYNFSRKWDDALATVDRAIAVSPSFAPAIGIRGAVLACDDQPEPAIRAVEEAIRLSPRDGFLPLWLLGEFWAYHSLRNYDQAFSVATRAVRAAPGNPSFRRQLAVACHMLGREQDAHKALEEFRALAPNASLVNVRNIPARNADDLERFVQALAELGLEE